MQTEHRLQPLLREHERKAEDVFDIF